MPDVLLSALAVLVLAVIGVLVHAALRLFAPPAPGPVRARGVGIGTVRAVDGPVTVDVESISGQRFVGRLRECPDEATMAALHPGVVLLVTFDQAARERLSLADDIAAIRAAFDRMLLDKGLVTPAQLDLIRNGTRSRGVVTAMRPTGGAREDYREVELDLMVRRISGGQFPAHETAQVPESALTAVAPGCVVDAYYRRGDESTVAVCVPPT
ncbi:hypothetical protein [Mycolicibacterium sp. 050158]|uniref:hypothetical protein n=1 Tax=Mycolicibacterium sp. 050158 TaxID=3090602 RepID=UPI00299E441C|nr:hypothetical protein [Mycolicibacterium sp. 050158]MDX1891607.1 hypothetical protein [Mycolicibacterium sp. 050158]